MQPESRFQNHQYHASRISLGWRRAGKITLWESLESRFRNQYNHAFGITRITLSESLESRFRNHQNHAFGITRIALSESRLFGPESGSAERQYSPAPQESQKLHHDGAPFPSPHGRWVTVVSALQPPGYFSEVKFCARSTTTTPSQPPPTTTAKKRRKKALRMRLDKPTRCMHAERFVSEFGGLERQQNNPACIKTCPSSQNVESGLCRKESEEESMGLGHSV